jgi:hypothetical protein
VEILKPVLEEFKKKEKEIGEQLTTATIRDSSDRKIIGACPACKTGKLIVIHSKHTRKRF